MDRILIVEDSKSINKMLKVELEKLTYLTDSAFTFAESSAFLQNTKYKKKIKMNESILRYNILN